MLLSLIIACCQILTADESPAEQTSSSAPLSHEETRTAIQKAIAPLQQGAAVSAKERKCFTCHNQAMPVIALTEVAKRGFAVDQEILQQQFQHTWDHLEKGKVTYQSGSGQGGQVMTAGYALWTLETGGWKSDETTKAVIHYLTEFQKDQNRWLPSSQRLPSMGSSFTATYVALRAMSYFGTDEQTAGIATRRDAAAKWVLETEPVDTEDRVFQLRTLPYIHASDEVVKKAVDVLLAKQRADGGWSQTDDMTSDAYATGTVVTALQEVGRLPGDHPAILSACRYLIHTQLEDGTWQVETHAKPIQPYYESGFPHGADQFISIAATAWATLALAGILPETKAEDKILFLNDGSALCLLRCETGSKNGLLGSSQPPFTEWTWKELGQRIGGPNMIQLPDGRILAATRLHSPKTRTSLSWIDPVAGTMTECLELPSGGDTSYAGMVLRDGLLWVSYYSSHEEKTCIYLAKVKL